jgi:hypothetical protein
MRWHSEFDRLIDGNFVVATADVLDKGLPGGDDSGAEVGLESAHRAQPSFELCGVQRRGPSCDQV